MKLITLGYVLALATLVVLADRGELDQYISFYKLIPYGDTLGHFLLMGTFSFLVNVAIKAREVRMAGRQFLLGSVVVFGIVLLEECSQPFFAGRTFSLLDLAADAVGIWFFGRLARVVCANRKRTAGRASEVQGLTR